MRVVRWIPGPIHLHQPQAKKDTTPPADIDVLVAYILPLGLWYVVPAGAFPTSQRYHFILGSGSSQGLETGYPMPSALTTKAASASPPMRLVWWDALRAACGRIGL
jgi:hypothetical protein